MCVLELGAILLLLVVARTGCHIALMFLVRFYGSPEGNEKGGGDQITILTVCQCGHSMGREC